MTIRVEIEDESVVFYRETIQVPREWVFAPGMVTPGMRPVAEALVAAQEGGVSR